MSEPMTARVGGLAYPELAHPETGRLSTVSEHGADLPSHLTSVTTPHSETVL